MSESVLTEWETERANSPNLSDIFDQFVSDDDLPTPEWLTKLRLDRPRRSTRCLSESTRLSKRLMDIVISATMLILLAPVMALVAVAVKLTSRGPVIFCQERVGLNQRQKRRDRRHSLASDPPDAVERRSGSRRQSHSYGKTFIIYKFRTMRVDAEIAGAQFAVKNDPRITSIGRFLRKTRLDELPQLWNVLTGEMSLVGPRPERPVFIEKLSAEIPNYLHRLGLKPGLTGLAQIINGYDNNVESFKRKVNLDLLYLQNCCVLNDVKILIRTIGVVVTGKGAM